MIETLLFGNEKNRCEKKHNEKVAGNHNNCKTKKNERLEKYELIKKLKAEGKSWNEIAKELHSTRLAVYQYYHYYSRQEGVNRVALKDLTDKDFRNNIKKIWKLLLR